MRIVKDQALALLRCEIAELGAQCQRCERQIAKFSSWGLDAMSGKAVSAAEQNVRMRAAVLRAQLLLFHSLRAADQRNMDLIAALPTTSAGVLDTVHAQDRCDRARRLAHALMRERDWWLSVSEPSQHLRIRRFYQRCVDAQWQIVKDYQRILEQASDYDRASLALYRGVSVEPARQALKSVQSFAQGGAWGSTAWAAPLFFQSTVRVYQGREAARAAQKPLVDQFMEGDLALHACVATGESRLERPQASQVSSGEVLGLAASLTPYHTARESLSDGARTVEVGACAQGAFGVATGSVVEKAGIMTGEMSGSVLTAAASGTLGASLAGDGMSGSTLVASVESKGAVAQVSAGATLGGEDFGVSAKVGGEALTVSGEAGVGYTDEGAEVCVGADAYVAKAKVSGGITFLGIGVVATVEGGVAGAGGKAAARIGDHALEGELAVGLGVGVGAKVRVDWSGFIPACRNVGNAAADWWNSLQTRKEEDDV